MKFHPVAEIFPMMSAEEFEALKADVAENGLREPIWTHEGQIIDGRNRYRACEAVGVEPTFRQWNSEGSLVAFVVSLNLQRRHLSSSQKAIIALDVEPLLAAEAVKRNSGRPGKNGQKPAQKIEQVFDRNKRSAAGQAATILGTNRQYVSRAKKLANTAPELLPLVRDGKTSIVEAVAASRNDKKTIEAIIAKVNSGEARSLTDARRLVHADRADAPRQMFIEAAEESPELALYRDAVEREEIEPVIYSTLARTGPPLTFGGLRLKSLARPFTGQTWHWPKYTGAVCEPIRESLQPPSSDLHISLFTEREWEEFTSINEGGVVTEMDFPGAKWFRWDFGLEFTWHAASYLREPWQRDGLRQRDYDPAYGRRFIAVLDDACTDCRDGDLFIRRGWGRWVVVEFNDGQGGREKRRFFEHDHCGPTVIKQALETVDPLAFSDANIRRLNIWKAAPIEISWHFMRHKTISRDQAIAALEADLEALRNTKPLTKAELTERVLDWLQAFTPKAPHEWREGDCTYPRLPDGSLDKKKYQECVNSWMKAGE